MPNECITQIKSLMSCQLDDGATRSHSLIEEKDPTAKLKKLKLSELAGNMLVIHLDEGRKVKSGNRKIMDCLSPLFATDGSGDHNRACDAVLIKETTNKDCELFYIDLKSDKPSGYAGQFASSQCFMRYVFEVINRLQGVDVHIVKERFIIFHTDTHARRQSIGKRNTRLSPAAANSAKTPDKYIVQNNETIDCRMIF